MKYRSEIDGLRAIAVVPVILFHAGFEIFSGGFVGVDVFFVISGYLITTIIINEMDEGKFSLLNFYERRARRILPALFFVVLCSLPFAWFLLMPSDMKDFSQSLVAVATFSSNILFWRESGYFDTAAELKPLLHTWSLAVEEQFYILFPLFLMAAWRFGKRAIVWTLVAAFVISLATAQWGAYSKPAATFYLLPTRAWELLIGSLAAFYLQKRSVTAPLWVSNALSAAGLLAILYGVFAFDEATPFPSVYALAPTAGTVLIILFAVRGTATHALLSLKAFVGVGLISYSLYLWHQPVFAFWRHYNVFEPTYLQMIMLSLLCLPLAYLTYRLVEAPLRIKRGTFTRNKVFVLASFGMFSTIAFGAFGHMSSGIPSRLPDKVLNFLDSTAANDLRASCAGADGEPCTIFESDENLSRHIFVIGDSHSSALLPAFREIGERADVRISHSGLGGCPPLLDVFIEDGNYELGVCESLSRQQFDFALRESVTTVVLVARWSLYVDNRSYSDPKNRYWLTTAGFSDLTLENSRRVFEHKLVQTVNSWLRNGMNVIVVEQVPQQELHPNQVISRAIRVSRSLEVPTFGVPLDVHRQLQAYANFQIRQLVGLGVQVINFESDLCADGICYMFNQFGSLYRDDDHLSDYGATSLVGAMALQLQ